MLALSRSIVQLEFGYTLKNTISHLHLYPLPRNHSELLSYFNANSSSTYLTKPANTLLTLNSFPMVNCICYYLPLRFVILSSFFCPFY
jgi:hypothetical protein